jgi:flagellar basal body-associated protein FliL
MAKEKKEKKEKEEKEPKEGGGRLKKIIIMVVPALAVGAGMFIFLGGGDAEAAAPTTTLAPIEGEVIPIDTLTVNLVGEEGRYARVGFAVVLDSMADSGIVGNRVPLMQDAALTILTGYNSEDLTNEEGMERLRRDLSDAVVAIFPDGEVLRAVLTEVVVQ